MTETIDRIAPQIYLITPPAFTLDTFPDQLARVLDATPVACLRLHMATQDEDAIARAADALRVVAHARDIALVIADHVLMVDRLGLDGVHLTTARQNLRKLREGMGPDAVIGTFCGTSRHEGMTAAEAGADYIAFGPVGDTGLGDGSRVDPEILEWWSEMIEVPCVVEGALTPQLITDLSPITDFFGVGEEIWASDDPAATLKALAARI
nr:thiamine phosphate synthase [Roseicitreum antarcticum]